MPTFLGLIRSERIIVMKEPEVEHYYEMCAEAYDYDKRRETGKRIKQCCKDSGYKLSDMALSIGIDPKSFYKIISGEVECRAKYLYEIAQLTEVSADYLLFGNGRTEGFEDIIAICERISIKGLERVNKVLMAFVD